jgi:hypothetical protein
MKKLILFTLAVGMIAGCTEPTVTKQTTQTVISMGDKPLEIVEIDSCEYLVSYYDRSRSLTDKGNCKNLIHKKDEQR